jgi:hypothetical protein
MRRAMIARRLGRRLGRIIASKPKRAERRPAVFTVTRASGRLSRDPIAVALELAEDEA